MINKKDFFVSREKGKPAPPVLATFNDELELLWGKKWGAQSELGKLRSVLVHRFGEEYGKAALSEDPVWYVINELPDLELAREQCDNLFKLLEKEGIEVNYLNPPSPASGPYSPINPRIWGTRDPGIVIDGGAIIGRMASPWRKGDEVFWTKRAVELGCPILYTVNGVGTFEGGNVVWLNPENVCIGRSIRTNSEGIRQVSQLMKDVGNVNEIIIVDLPGYLENIKWPAGGFPHLDCVFGMVDFDLAMVYPPALPYDFIAYLKQEKKIELIEILPQEQKKVPSNIIALEPKKIIMNSGCGRLVNILEKKGVNVIQIDIGEFNKTGGGLHCAIAPLIRDKI